MTDFNVGDRVRIRKDALIKDVHGRILQDEQAIGEVCEVDKAMMFPVRVNWHRFTDVFRGHELELIPAESTSTPAATVEVARKTYQAAKALPPDTRLTRSVRYEEAADALIDALEAALTAEQAARARAEAALREPLAGISHEIWSSWMLWMFTVGTFHADNAWTMPAGLVERWQRQMRTPYAELTEHEKDSDREQADKILAVLVAQPVPGAQEGT